MAGETGNVPRKKGKASATEVVSPAPGFIGYSLNRNLKDTLYWEQHLITFFEHGEPLGN
jgi:hypothetical protein